MANGTVSDTVTVEYGVPQGSILGPSLFIYYVNKISALETQATVKMYADDVVIYAPDTTPEVALNMLNVGLKKLESG